MSASILHWAQFFAFVFGGLAALSTFLAVGLPIVGKYPGHLRHALGELFTGDLQDMLEAELKKTSGDIRMEARDSNVQLVQAVHDLTTITADNHSQAMGIIGDLSQRLHAHETNTSIHRSIEP